MSDMTMPWMLSPNQSWLGATASFAWMWFVMMAAMMAPVLAPALWRYRRSLRAMSEPRRAKLLLIVGAAYFAVWTLAGLAAFPIGVTLMELEMRSTTWASFVPLASAVVVVAAGAVQFTKWKARQLACCREWPGCDCTLPTDAASAWRQGVALGKRCVYCCADLTVVLLVLGMMDLSVMIAVTAAITLERLAPTRLRVAQTIGVVAVFAGVGMVVRAFGAA